MTAAAAKQMEVELNGKRYLVRFYEKGALVSVMTKVGWRTLGGHGRADRANEARAAIAAAQCAAQRD